MALKSWSTTAGDNDNADASINWEENQAPSTVNGSARAMMAATRSWYDDLEWRDWGHAVTRTGATTFTVATDVTAIYATNRPIRCTDSSTLYGIVASSSYSAPNTTVTVTLDSGSLSASLTAVSLGFTPTNQPLHADSVRNVAKLTGTQTIAGAKTFSDNAAFNGDVTITGAFTYVPSGVILPYGGSSAPTGFLLCDGSAVSRTTYSALFTAISTAFGAGDGSTTFNLPDLLGRTPIGSGTGTLTEDVTDANVSTGSDTFTVASNSTKWITGMSCVLTTTTTLPTGLSLATTYYVIRDSSTTIKFASSREDSMVGTAIDITAVAGSGTHTLTHTLTARTLGEKLGEEGHTQLEAEVGYHRHRERGAADGTNQGGMNRIAAAGDSTSSQYTEYSNYDDVSIGDPLNIMQPSLVLNYIIKT